MSAASQRQANARRFIIIRKAMSDPDGREWFYNVLASCHVYSTSFATNALAMAYREGERNVGLRLTTELTEACPDLYLIMLKEAGNVRQRPDIDTASDTASATASDGNGDATGDYPNGNYLD